MNGRRSTCAEVKSRCGTLAVTYDAQLVFQHVTLMFMHPE